MHRAIAHPPDFRGPRRPVVQLNAAPQLVHPLLAHRRGSLHPVRLRHLVLGVHHALGKPGVVGHDQQAAGIEIQAAHGRKPRAGIRDQVINRWTAFRVAVSSQISFGLIEQNVKFGRGLQWLAVERDAVALQIYPVIGVFDDLPVHANLAGPNPASGVRSGTDPALGKHSL